LRPGIFVELGTHNGFSYLAFCQAVQRLGGMTKCYGVDTWMGDEHAGFYGEEVFAALNEVHERHYSGFSRLVRSTFDEALPHFGDGTVDLLHIDGRHRYEDVVHDFESWLPKLSDRAVVLLHDINVRERGFGVWQFWRDLQSHYPCFEFAHGHGLGVVRVGRLVAEPVRPLFDSDPQSKAAIAERYAQLGRGATAPHELETARARLATLESENAARGRIIEELEVETKELRAALNNAESWARDREARLATLENEDATRGRIIKELEVETKGLRAALNNAEGCARDREATIEVMGAETARIKAALAAAQLRDEELQRIRQQVAELRDAVAQAEREAQERSAVEAAMRSNIAEALEAARRRSATAERSAAALELAQRRAADAEGNAAVLGEEVASLKTELADARHVGRTTLQALAASKVGSIYREPRLGWRHAMRRLFGIVRSR
jgi:hypothetical protein